MEKSPDYWQEACIFLAEQDAIMAHIIAGYGTENTLTTRGNGFYTLLRCITGQQISVKAAESVWQKLDAALQQQHEPQQLDSLSDDALRACGLSKQKVSYLRNIAKACLEHGLTENHFRDAAFDELSKKLLAIKGVGPWTIDMFGMFYRLEPDIFPKTDLGIVNAIKQHYGVDANMDAIAQKWQPYRTVATWYLWRSLDPIPVQY